MKKEIFKNKLEEIDRKIKLELSNETQIGVLSGLSGISLFYFYYAKYLNEESHLEFGLNIMTKSIDKINDGYDYPTYCAGIAGTGWVIDHIAKEQFLDIESDNLLSKLDDYLYTSMVNALKKGNYDFLHGAIGYAFYFLNRYRNTKQNILREKYKVFLLEFIDLLKTLADKTDKNKLKWLSIIDHKSKKEVYNFSLSHGMSSIIGILTKLQEYEDFKIHTENMLRSTINYILGFKNNKQNSFSLFPIWISEEDSVIYNGRLAWCYGDLGIAIRFWYASKVLNDKNLGNIAIDILKHAAKRTKQTQSLVQDAYVCHGSYGNAQIFHRMYKETNKLLFKEARDFWIKDGINRVFHNEGFTGYKQRDGIDKDWGEKISLLEGLSGIGLTIIDYLADFDTTWDECLMIS